MAVGSLLTRRSWTVPWPRLWRRPAQEPTRSSAWIRIRGANPNPSAQASALCFPHAGRSAHGFPQLGTTVACRPRSARGSTSGPGRAARGAGFHPTWPAGGGGRRRAAAPSQARRPTPSLATASDRSSPSRCTTAPAVRMGPAQPSRRLGRRAPTCHPPPAFAPPPLPMPGLRAVYRVPGHSR